MPPEKVGDVSVDRDASERDLARTQREMSGELMISSLRAHEEADAAVAREEELRTMGELRERLVGILGHDLRAPLSTIMMAAGAIGTDGSLTEHDARAVALIVKCGHRMERMIFQLLDFTRVRLGGGVGLQCQPSDLGEVCRGVAQELEVAAAVSVRCVTDGDVAGSFDPDRMSEAISNIAGNAVHHARAGTSVVLHVDGTGADIAVEISNEGAPIPADLLPFIFEPFRRARQPAHFKAGHLGLGLYIAHEVVRAHGGCIDARCADGTTTFRVRLPRRAPAPASRGGPI
jgi:signal transduction histidine kinase